MEAGCAETGWARMAAGDCAPALSLPPAGGDTGDGCGAGSATGTVRYPLSPSMARISASANWLGDALRTLAEPGGVSSESLEEAPLLTLEPLVPLRLATTAVNTGRLPAGITAVEFPTVFDTAMNALFNPSFDPLLNEEDADDDATETTAWSRVGTGSSEFIIKLIRPRNPF